MPTWPDGSKHTISWQQHLNDVATELAKRKASQAAASQQATAAARAQAAAAQAASQAHAHAMASMPAPAAPAAPPAAPTFQPDSAYNNDVDFADRQHTQTIGDIGEAEKKTKYDYGFDDPTNPFSRVNEAKKLYLANSNRSNTAMSSMGQSTSGAYQRAILRDTHNEEKGNASLRAAYEDALAELKRRRTGADNTLESAKLEAMRQALARAGA